MLSGYPQSTPLLGGKRKGPLSDKDCAFVRENTESLGGGSSQCGIVNFYPLELHLHLDNVVLCRLAWAAQPLACHQALQENLLSATAPENTGQTLGTRRKTKQKNPSEPTTTQGDLINPNPL